MSEWLPLWRKDMTVKELVDLFKDKPMQFEPGASWAYNNSGYVLLGAIIEKASGRTYADFVQDRMFKPLGLKGSSYDDTERVVPRRVRGYQKGDGGFVNAPYLSMSQPYAAGSLMSTVDDLAVWSDAVFSGRLVRKDWLDRAFTPFALANGESSGYGYGWFVGDFAGHRSIEHGGGINGFTSYELTLPGGQGLRRHPDQQRRRRPRPRAAGGRDRLAGPGPGRTGAQGRDCRGRGPRRDRRRLRQRAPKQEYWFSREGAKFFAQRQGGEKNELYPASPTEFFLADNPARFEFVKDAAGRVTGLRDPIPDRSGPGFRQDRQAPPLPAAGGRRSTRSSTTAWPGTTSWPRTSSSASSGAATS